MKTTYPMIPFPVIVAATDGDTEAINQIVKPLQRLYRKTLPPPHERRIRESAHGRG